MTWNVEYTDEFEERFWNGLSESEQEDIAATVSLLEARGPNLPFPYCPSLTDFMTCISKSSGRRV